ncbi:MAG: MFS transporter [Clostridia bacterium]|nr:MFS transporter [Clostridia bacterium]
MSETVKNYTRTKRACFYTYLAMSSVFSLPPMLFVTFRETYGISYTLLGTLVLINFCTQLIIDLIFTFFSKYFNIKLTIRLMPLLTSLGLTVYALVPTFFPDFAYAGFVLGTVIFSVAAGLCEVLLSPLVAALPSENPEKDMSMLHSLYAYGVVTVVLVSTLFLKFFGTQNWMYLTLFWAALPVASFVLFSTSPMPDMNLSESESSGKKKKRLGSMWLCVLCIFFGSAAENAMTNWISGYVENALGISKVTGDILGMALFAVCLGVGRTAYAKKGKDITSVLIGGMAGALLCYLIAGLSPHPTAAMVACVLTGLYTSMLWPGTLILMEEYFPTPGVAAYALMAAGGDFGGSIAPQMLGAVVDAVSQSSWAASFAPTVSVTTEQLGMKVGMLTASIFPLLGLVVLAVIVKKFKKPNNI